MLWRRICKSLFAGVAFMAAAGTAAANHGGGGGDCGGCGNGGGCGTMKVSTVEWVTEQVPCTRTVYKTEWREETRHGTRTEYTQECRTGTKTCYKTITETVNENRCYTVKVPYTETRHGCETRWVSRQVTETVNVSVDRGHYECVEVPVTGLRGCLMKMGHKMKGGRKGCGDCCDPCASCCEYCPTETKKVWCPCIVCEPKCVTRCVKECVQVPTTYCVTCYRCETRTECVPVCRTRCVPECVSYTYTVCVPRCVPYTYCCKVPVCVPCQETYTVCRRVPVCVEK